MQQNYVDPRLQLKRELIWANGKWRATGWHKSLRNLLGKNVNQQSHCKDDGHLPRGTVTKRNRSERQGGEPLITGTRRRKCLHDLFPVQREEEFEETAGSFSHLTPHRLTDFPALPQSPLLTSPDIRSHLFLDLIFFTIHFIFVIHFRLIFFFFFHRNKGLLSFPKTSKTKVQEN